MCSVCLGSLQVRYNLGGLREPFAIDVDQRNLANGQTHNINMSRIERTITVQVQLRLSNPLEDSQKKNISKAFSWHLRKMKTCS